MAQISHQHNTRVTSHMLDHERTKLYLYENKAKHYLRCIRSIFHYVSAMLAKGSSVTKERNIALTGRQFSLATILSRDFKRNRVSNDRLGIVSEVRHRRRSRSRLGIDSEVSHRRRRSQCLFWRRRTFETRPHGTGSFPKFLAHTFITLKAAQAKNATMSTRIRRFGPPRIAIIWYLFWQV